MNIARTICKIRYRNVGQNFVRKFRFSVSNLESVQATQPQVQEEKYDFEDLNVLERTERRKAKIKPFMKDVFVSVFNRELLAYPEILNKEETEALNQRISIIEKAFTNKEKTRAERKEVLKKAKLYAGPVSLTQNGLAMNATETLRYLEAISSDVELSQEMSDHWVALEALKIGLNVEDYQKIIDDLTSGDRPIALCIREKVAERISQADFRTQAAPDEKGVWRVTGEKICHQCDGYMLVLCATSGDRLKALLVHPDAEGVTKQLPLVSFRNTPGLLLSCATDEQLSRALAASRLHGAGLCRAALVRALRRLGGYVRGRVFAGKPLADLSTIRATIGETLLDIYASESVEYFTAGLLDGYMEPDAELEMAMCRNFMAQRGMSRLLSLLAIPSVDDEEDARGRLQEMRGLVLRGESLDSVNMFLALNGIHHAGKVMAQEVKQIRNPLLHPAFIIKKAFANRHQDKDAPKLTLQLSEHLHPSLRPPADQLEYCVLRLRFACETLMSRHGVEVATAFTELIRLAEAATDVLVMTAVLARASRSYCIGLRNAEVEMKLAACFVEQTKDRVKKLILEIDDGEYLNLDFFKLQFGRKVLDQKSLLVEKPIARVFW